MVDRKILAEFEMMFCLYTAYLWTAL